MYCQEKGTELPVSEYKSLVRVEEVGNGHKAEMETEPYVTEGRGYLKRKTSIC
jgi:hypothetical protein